MKCPNCKKELLEHTGIDLCYCPDSDCGYQGTISQHATYQAKIDDLFLLLTAEDAKNKALEADIQATQNRFEYSSELAANWGCDNSELKDRVVDLEAEVERLTKGLDCKTLTGADHVASVLTEYKAENDKLKAALREINSLYNPSQRFDELGFLSGRHTAFREAAAIAEGALKEGVE